MLGPGEIAGLKMAIDVRTDRLKSGLERAEREMVAKGKSMGTSFSRAFNFVLGHAGPAGVVYGLQRMGREALATMDNLAKMSRVLSISVEDLQKYQFAAQQSGLSNQELEQSFIQLGTRLSQVASGLQNESSRAFDALNVKTKNLAGETRGLSEVYKEVLDRLSKVNNEADRVRLSRELFGRAGANVTKLGDAANLEALGAERAGMGLVNKEQAEAAERFNDAISAMITRMKAFTADKVGKGLVEGDKALQGGQAMTASMYALADVIVNSFIPQGFRPKDILDSRRRSNERFWARPAAEAVRRPKTRGAAGAASALFPELAQDMIAVGEGNAAPFASQGYERSFSGIGPTFDNATGVLGGPQTAPFNLDRVAAAVGTTARTFQELNKVLEGQLDIQRRFQEGGAVKDKLKFGGMLNADDLALMSMERNSPIGRIYGDRFLASEGTGPSVNGRGTMYGRDGRPIVINFNGPATFEKPTEAVKTANMIEAMGPRHG